MAERQTAKLVEAQTVAQKEKNARFEAELEAKLQAIVEANHELEARFHAEETNRAVLESAQMISWQKKWS